MLTDPDRARLERLLLDLTQTATPIDFPRVRRALIVLLEVLLAGPDAGNAPEGR